MAVQFRKLLSLIYVGRKSQPRAAEQIPNIRSQAGRNAIWKCCGKARLGPSKKYLRNRAPTLKRSLGLAIPVTAMGSIYWTSKDGRFEMAFSQWTHVLQMW